MKLGQLTGTISSFATALDHAGATAAARSLTQLARMLSRFSKLDTDKLIATAAKQSFVAGRSTDHPMSVLVSPLDDLVRLLSEAKGGKPLISALKQLVDLASQYSEISIAEFESSVASALQAKTATGADPVEIRQLVESYLERL